MKNIIYFIAICMIIILSNCTKGLDLVPKDSISDRSFWINEKDFELAANNFYWILDVPKYETFADLLYGSGPDEISNSSYLIPDNSNDWKSPYETIRGTNYLIENAAGSLVKDKVQRYVGEAMFFRALSYFRLVKTFGDVPLITKVLEVNSDDLNAPRTERTIVVDFILDDLDKAILLLPKLSELKANELGRITSGAALALKARVSLFEGTWQKYHGTNKNVDKYLSSAIDASNKVITSGEYQLYSDPVVPERSFNRVLDYFGDNSNEVILSSRFEALIRTHNYSRFTDEVHTVTKKLADLFLCTDGLPVDKSPLFNGYATLTSEFINRDPRMSGTILPPGTPFARNVNGYVAKPYYFNFTGRGAGYIMRKGITEAGSEQFNQLETDDWKMIRYAEVLLIYAEAKFEKDGSISNADLNKSINVLRKRTGVNMPEITNEFVTSNGLDMKTEIRRERTVELALEGLRLDDLKRWKTAEIEMPMAIRGVKFKGTEYEIYYNKVVVGKNVIVDVDGFVVVENESKRTFQQKHYLFPLPRVQLQLNPNLTQNPGW